MRHGAEPPSQHTMNKQHEQENKPLPHSEVLEFLLPQHNLGNPGWHNSHMSLGMDFWVSISSSVKKKKKLTMISLSLEYYNNKNKLIDVNWLCKLTTVFLYSVNLRYYYWFLLREQMAREERITTQCYFFLSHKTLSSILTSLLHWLQGL